ncbi:MAG: 1-(5-phosphoribosyl)-5-[(5-phosphoribosylamino)methylideneamino]imidazole-4-carboxamide isomerase [Lachnospiraceae bacterium]|jgi:phosphoribosylformimino-5-aminoimidazole carboxamide ribotide isomerase|nr:1-(5-phosphoribosyl)-5-[(5-phosphoribosylamino)methylideneamino]imidazole-4-carboxamide isomerase [Lachnospiraceae bacterium]
MRLYPAIDIKEGRCVRLRQGHFGQVQVYSDSPAKTALTWEAKGASWLHLVDLDGALRGRSVNAGCLRDILKAVHIRTELGGGIRSLKDIEEALNLGVTRAIIGTAAVEHPEMVGEAVRLFGSGHIAVGIDARDGMVATQGWEQTSRVSAMDLALRMKELGVSTVIYTDISRDGMLTGPNVEATRALSEATGLQVVASGGVSSMEDLFRLSQAGIHGAIIGKALYENRIDLSEALQTFEKNPKQNQ